MKLVLQNNRFEVEDYTKKLPNFTVDEETLVQYTVDSQIAMQYIHYCDEVTSLEIYKQFYELKTIIDQSRKLDSDIFVPAPRGCTYDPYQLAAIEFGIPRKRVMLSDEVRLGKTIEAVGIINYSLWIKEYIAPRGLVICQGHLRRNWQRELSKWLIEEHGIEYADTKYWPMYSQWVILNYELLEQYYEEIRMRKWEYLIIDELHKLKNITANRTKYAYGDAFLEPIPADRVIAISGTPIPNRPIEIFPTLNFLDKETYNDRIQFGIRYCDGKKSRDGKKWDFKGASNLTDLQAKLRSSLMVRRLFDEVFPQMPAKRRQILEIPAGEGDLEWIKAEQEAWDSYAPKMEEAKEKVKQAKDLHDLEAFKDAMDKLKYTQSIVFSKISAFRHKTAIAKIPFILTYIEDVLSEGGKLVVFAHHHEIVESIYNKFKDINPAIWYGGSLAKEDPLDAQDRFQNDPSCTLGICAITMTEGRHLTASHHELFAEFSWVPGDIEQAEGRCRGRESTNPLLIQFCVLEHSLDARMCHKIVDKLNVREDALDTKDVEVEELDEVVI